MTAPAPPSAAALRPLIEDLRADLEDAHFTVDGIAAYLGPEADAALHREQALPARRVVADRPGVTGALVGLFTLGAVVRLADVERAFPRTGTSALGAAGLLHRTGGGVRASVDLRPYADEDHAWWLLSDLGELATGEPLPAEHVLGVGGASATLASWTPRPRVARALDLGTGCGVQALHLCAHVDTVVATDVSARALAFAACNDVLNPRRGPASGSATAWDLRQGDLFDPVAGERFDLVVSNPPFVVTPRRPGVPRYDYRDGGRVGDAFVAELVRGVGAHLEPGGIAHFLANWEIPAGATWQDRWAEWLDGTGLDAYVVQRDEQDPCEYAETWVRDGGHRPGTPAHDALYAAWLDDFAARGVGSVGFGVATLSLPERPGARAATVDLVSHPGPVAAPMGPAVLAGVRARAWLADHGTDALLASTWVAARDVTEERYAEPGADGPRVIRIRQGGGLGVVVPAGTVLSAFVSVCDGDLAAGPALAAIAALLERPVADVVAEALPGLRALVADGLLVRGPTRAE